MEKTLNIDDKKVRMKSTAGTLYRYRNQFGRDMLKDIISLQEKLNKVSKGAEQFNAVDLELFEKMAWSMAKTADPNTVDIENWLDEFEAFSIIKILPELTDLITGNLKQNNETKNV